MRTQPITLTAVGALLVGVAACLDVADMASPTSDPEPRLDGQSSEWPPPGYVPFTLHGWMTGELGREYTREDVEEMGVENARLLLHSTLLARLERELAELLAQPDAHERTTRYGLNMVQALQSDIRFSQGELEWAKQFTNRFREPEPLAAQECLDEPEISSFFGSPDLHLQPSLRGVTVRGSASHLTTTDQKHYIKIKVMVRDWRNPTGPVPGLRNDQPGSDHSCTSRNSPEVRTSVRALRDHRDFEFFEGCAKSEHRAFNAANPVKEDKGQRPEIGWDCQMLDQSPPNPLDNPRRH